MLLAVQIAIFFVASALENLLRQQQPECVCVREREAEREYEAVSMN